MCDLIWRCRTCAFRGHRLLRSKRKTTFLLQVEDPIECFCRWGPFFWLTYYKTLIELVIAFSSSSPEFVGQQATVSRGSIVSITNTVWRNENQSHCGRSGRRGEGGPSRKGNKYKVYLLRRYHTWEWRCYCGFWNTCLSVLNWAHPRSSPLTILESWPPLPPLLSEVEDEELKTRRKGRNTWATGYIFWCFCFNAKQKGTKKRLRVLTLKWNDE